MKMKRGILNMACTVNDKSIHQVSITKNKEGRACGASF